MEISTWTHNLTLSLPEIIFKIMEFLPNPDLESVSLVNSTWEKEALRRLLRRHVVDVHLHAVHDSMDLVPLKNLHPKILNVTVCLPSEKNAEDILLSKIELFTATSFNTVTKLCLNIPLDNALRHVASRFAKIYESLKNLKSLEFQLILVNYQELFTSNDHWADLLPDSSHHLAQKPLTTLTLNMSRLYLRAEEGRWDNAISLTTRILTVFRHAQNFKMIDTPGILIQRNDLILPHFKSISFHAPFVIGEESSDPILKFKGPLNPNFANVTRLEFNVTFYDATNGHELLHLLAPQLEHVCIFAVENVTPTEPVDTSSGFIRIPILPRLKVFEILRNQILSCGYDTSWFRPFLYLNFETERDAVKLVYVEQFPVLEKLIVRVVEQPSPKWMLEMGYGADENMHFEATMLFLYETFLAEGVAPCETVRDLDIFFPAGGKDWDVGRMRMKWRHEGNENWGWKEDVPDFYGRISTIFPNVQYHVVERGKAAVRMARSLRSLKSDLMEIFGDEG